MADARDRTVATNYAREAMEDVKNMDFEKIITTTKSVSSSNIKYRVDVNVSSESDNLKKVLTVVSWKDRDGTDKTVKTTMLVNITEIYPSKAAKIVLFADSYTIFDTDTTGGTADTTELTAIIKDVKGNTVIDWNVGDITFSILSGAEFGSLDPVTVTPDNGIAKTTFSSNHNVLVGEIGYTEIKASVNLPIIGNVSDSVTIKVTDGPVKIVLEANPKIIKASSTNYSTITVSLCDAAEKPVDKSDLGTDVKINFSVFGEGSLPSGTDTDTITFFKNDSGLAIAYIILDSTGASGLASVMAVADTADLESDTADVRFLGPPVSISISANPNQIYLDDIVGSTITVSLIDEKGFSTNPAEEDIDVTFLLSPVLNGSLSPDLLTFIPNDFDGISLTTQFSGQNSTEGVTITTVNEVELINGSVFINILSSLEPDHFELTASTQNVVAGDISTITATVYDGIKIVTNYAGTITFETDLGYLTDYNLVNGIATIKLSSDSAGIATITASSSDGLDCIPENGIVVGFYLTPDHIELTPISQDVKIGSGNFCTITATVYDNVEGNNIIVTNYAGTITFETDLGYFTDYNLVNGIATIKLSSDSAGIATITAFSPDGLVCIPSGGVEVDFYEETTLTLVDNSVIYDLTDKTVTFEVKVIGGSIEVDEMKIIWSESGPQERFSEIVIDGVIVYTGGSDKSATIVDIEDKTLLPGEHTIRLTFIQDMAGRQIDVMFYPIEGWYLIRFDVP